MANLSNYFGIYPEALLGIQLPKLDICIGAFQNVL
jgi:hypothetical protein